MIYFDNAATGFPKSASAANAMRDACLCCGNPGRSGHLLARRADEILYNCRKKLASLFGSVPERVILTKGATEALNYAIKGLYREDSEVLCSNMEHNAVMRPLQALRMCGEIVLKQFRAEIADDNVTVDNFRLAVGKHSDMAVVTHASNVCGRVLPLAEMRAAVGREDFLMIADCSQTAGHIPIDIRQLGVDAICVPGHKGLFGPMGTGALILHPDRAYSFCTIIEGGSGIDSRAISMPEVLPERLEAGTPNVCGFAGLCAALDEVTFDTDEMHLYQQLVDGLIAKKEIRLHGYHAHGAYVPTLLINKQNRDCEELAEYLAENGVAVRAGLHCAPCAHRALGTLDSGGVRISLSKHNTEEEIQRFLQLI
ncbi:MAG: aminotransferase class V-fold PLP-dependent enzyme [Clostridia bacterium]|nr:aminotransferase class V-fold PLP-dependent enzyme [Clostridia bacterium]